MRRIRGDVELAIVEQPLEVFYKDEGGRSNCLEAQLELVGGLSDADFEKGPMSLSWVACYEDGTEMSKADQAKVVRVTSPRKSLSFTQERRIVTFRWRYEVVAKRQKNRKFMIRFIPENCTGVKPVCTVSTYVFSKRKYRTPIDRTSTVAAGTRKLRAGSNESDEADSVGSKGAESDGADSVARSKGKKKTKVTNGTRVKLKGSKKRPAPTVLERYEEQTKLLVDNLSALADNVERFKKRITNLETENMNQSKEIEALKQCMSLLGPAASTTLPAPLKRSISQNFLWDFGQPTDESVEMQLNAANNSRPSIKRTLSILSDGDGLSLNGLTPTGGLTPPLFCRDSSLSGLFPTSLSNNG